MKKLLYLFALTAIFACNSIPESTNNAKMAVGPPLAPARLTTLNGLTFAQADEMVRRFIQNSNSSHPVTSFWFTEAYLDTLRSVLDYEGAAGVRIYFAKDASGNNQIAMVSTRDSIVSGTTVQRDYFLRNTNLLTGAYATPKPSYDQPRGAGLYTMGNYPQNCTDVSDYHLANETAARFVQNFRNDQPAGRPLKIKTSYVWYPKGIFEELKKYLIQAKAQNLDPDGFRIYFMRKDNVKQTVSFVMVPTLADPSDENIHNDYYECLQRKWKIVPASDNGKECPSFCDPDPTWGEPDSTKTNPANKNR